TLLASTLEKLQLFDEAFEVWWSLYLEAETDSTRSEAVAKLSQMAMQRGTFAEVVRRLNQKLQQNEQDRTILIGLAEAHLAVQDLISARSTLEKLLQRDDRSVVVIGQLASICDRLGDYEAAAGYRRRQFRLEPNEATEGQYILALQRAGLYDEAESLIMAHIGPETSSAELLQMIDRAIEDGAIDLSVRICNTFIERNQHPELGLLRLGVLQWTEGNKEEACNTFQKILQVTQKVPFAQFFDCISPGKEAPASSQFVDAAILRQRLFAVRVLLHLEEISEEEMQYMTAPTIGLLSPRTLNRTAFSEINTTAAVREFALAALVTANVLSDKTSEPGPEATSRGENEDKASDRAAIAAWDRWICATLEPVDSTGLEAVQPLLETGFSEGTIAYLHTCFSMTLRGNEGSIGESDAKKAWSTHLALIKRRVRQLAATDPSTATLFFARCIIRAMPDEAALNNWITELTSEEAASTDCRLGLLLEFSRTPTASPRWTLRQCKSFWRRVLTPTVSQDSAAPSDASKDSVPIPVDLLAPWIMHSAGSLSEDDVAELVSDWIELSTREPGGARLTVQYPQSLSPYEDFWAAVFRSCSKRPGLLASVAGKLEQKYRGVTGRREFLAEVALAHLATYRNDQIAAARHWIRCVQFDPKNSTVRREVSEALQRAGLYAEAITVLDGIDEADPNRMKADELRVLRLAKMTTQKDRAELSLRRLAGIQLSSDELSSLIKTADDFQLTEIAAELRSRPTLTPQVSVPKSQYEYVEEYERLGKTAEAIAIAKQIARKKIGDASYNFRQQNTRSPFQMRERAFELLKKSGALEEMISEQKSLLNASPNSQVLKEELAMFLRAAGRDNEAKDLEGSSNDDGAVSRGKVRQLLSDGNSEAASQLILEALKDPRKSGQAKRLLEENTALLIAIIDSGHLKELLAAHFNATGRKGSGRQVVTGPRFGGNVALVLPDTLELSMLSCALFDSADPISLLPEIQQAWKVSEASVGFSVFMNTDRKKTPNTKTCSALIELIGWVGEPENEGKRESRSLLVGSVLQILQNSFLQASKEEQLALHETVLRVRSSRPALREWPFFVAFTASQCGQPDVAAESLQSIVEESRRSPFPADCLMTLDSMFPEKKDLDNLLVIYEATLCSPVSSQRDGELRRDLFDTMLARVNSHGGRDKFRAMIPRLKYCSQMDEYHVAKALMEHFPWQGLIALSDQTSMGRQTPEQINAIVEACAGSLRMTHLVDEWQFLQTTKQGTGDPGTSIEVNGEISLNTDGRVAMLCPLLVGIMDRPAFGSKDDPAPLLKLWIESSTQKFRPSGLFLSSAVLLLKQANADVRRQVAERLIELARSGELYPDLSDTRSVDFNSRKQSVKALLILGRKLEKTQGCEELSEVLMTSAKEALLPVATVSERLMMAKMRGDFLVAASRREEAAEEFREVLNLLLSQPDTAARLDSMAIEALRETLDQDKTELLNELRKTGLAP
ncbi:MAG: tetratricopeptide repeat protein, partial [Planctomycetaceae bacterium]|nr:tetratricopeptide repeat protein [Planctomycetaceae bacterium]